jgi:hypothetical protein
MSTALGRPSLAAWRWWFLAAALYDMVLGVAFMVAGDAILTAIGMTPPPHVAYYQLAAVFVFVQGFSYLLVWRNPANGRGLVWVGVAYKAAYTALAVWYIALGMLPSAFFVPWAAADFLFMLGFLWFLRGPWARRTA